MMYSMYQLASKNDACKKSRNFSYEIKSNDSNALKKSSAVLEADKAILLGTKTEKEAFEDLATAFDGITFSTNQQRKAQLDKAIACIKRHTNEDKRPYIDGEMKKIDLGNGVETAVKPLIVVDNVAKTCEVISLHYSKARNNNLNGRNIAHDLRFFALYRYAEAYIAEKLSSGYKPVASMYFLAKNTDTNGKTPQFDTSFWNDECNPYTGKKGAGNNVLRLNSLNEKELNELSEKFAEGVEKDACTAEDCKNCRLNEICNYKEPPIPIVKESVVKKASELMLTEAQEEVVCFKNGIARVNAGAGAGKTTVVSLRVCNLIEDYEDEGISNGESKILLITFTHNGAIEMKNRIRSMLSSFKLGADVEKMHITTFNSLGYDVIKDQYKALGFSDEPKMIDEVERAKIIAQILNDNPIKNLNMLNFELDMQGKNGVKGALAVTKRVFEVIKKRGYTLSDFDQIKAEVGSMLYFVGDDAVLTELIKLYDIYDETLRRENLVEYADQDQMPFEILKDNPYYFEDWGIEHIIIDEFQDTSIDQLELIKKFRECKSFKSLMVVGDDAQAIFGFRGVSPEYLIHFDKYIGEPITDFFMVENHRSTPEILDFANKINNLRDKSEMVQKSLVSTRPSGEPVKINGFWSTAEEYKYIVDTVKSKLASGVHPEDVAILMGSNSEIEKVASLLTAENIASVMLNPEQIKDNSRVQATLALATFLRDTSDTHSALVYANACLGGRLLDEFFKAKPADANAIVDGYVEQMIKIAENYHALKDDAKKERFISLCESIDFYNDEIFNGFLETLASKPSIYHIMSYIDSFKLYGEKATIRRTADYPAVVLTTAHSSKGLEWKNVIFSLDKIDQDACHSSNGYARKHREERLRLLFVGATRARDTLEIVGTYAYSKDKNKESGIREINTFLYESAKALLPEEQSHKFSQRYVSEIFLRKEQEANERRKAKAKK